MEPLWQFDGTVENTLDDGGDRFGGRRIFVHLFADIHQGSEYLPFLRSPFFDAATLWNGLGDALAARSSADPDGADGPQIWIWIGLLLAGIIVAVIMQRTGVRETPKPEVALKSATRSGPTWHFFVSRA